MSMGHTLRYAVRRLKREPGPTAFAICALSVGLGANIVVASLVRTFLISPLPYPQPERLVVVREVIEDWGKEVPSLPANMRHFRLWESTSSSFEELAALRPKKMVLGGDPVPQELVGVTLSANLFRLLGATPLLGRHFSAEEELLGRDQVVILSETLWRQRFGANPSIVGETVPLNAERNVVVGVVPNTFSLPSGQELGAFGSFTSPPEIFKPLGLDLETVSNTGAFDYIVIGRLRPGITLEQANEELDTVQAVLGWDLPGDVRLRGLLVPLREFLTRDVKSVLLLLQLLVSSVLIMICANIAGLFVTRSLRYRRAAAIQTVLGAPPSTLQMQSFLDAFLIALVSGACGLFLADGILNTIEKTNLLRLPHVGKIGLDSSAAVIALGIATTAAVVVGGFIVIGLGKANLREILQVGGAAQTVTRSHTLLRTAFAGLQVMISVLVLLNAGLLVHSVIRLVSVDRGFQVQGVLRTEVVLPQSAGSKYQHNERRLAFFQETLADLSAIPGVAEIGMVSVAPLGGEGEVHAISYEYDNRPEYELPQASVRFVSPGYFRALSIGLHRGRLFDWQPEKGPFVVISRRVADSLWPGQNAVGERLRVGDLLLAEVVGVVADTRAISLRQSPGLTVYVPYWFLVPGRASILLQFAVG